MTPAAYDTIVVGAGSAGCALAYRLAEHGVDVLLLDAGPDYAAADTPSEFRSPNPSRALVHEWAGRLLWPGLTARRTEAQGARSFLRGRGVGGSSVINGQIAIRPPMEDFDRWAAGGCPGWAAADVLPSFRRLEDDAQFGDASYHGVGGPTPVHRVPREEWGGVDSALRQAALDAGFGWSEDVNAPGSTGISPYPINSRAGRRVNVKDSYIEPGRDLQSLHVVGDALVDRVEFSGPRAIGVRVVLASGVLTFRADRVVLAAGAVHSPAILQRSGIGPEDTLRRLDISTRIDLPVGIGLQDHPMGAIPLPLNAAARPRSVDARHTNCCVRYSSGGAEFNDMMIVSSNHVVSEPGELDADTQYGFLGVWVNQVHSRGELAITSADPLAAPRIDERMLSDERDRARLRAGIRMVARLSEHEAFEELTRGAVVDQSAEQRVGVPMPTPAQLADDAALDRYLMTTAGDAAHITSTCRMGSADAADTVVDPSARVHGVEGLLVADASIFPDCPRSNTHLACVMVGEHVATLLTR